MAKIVNPNAAGIDISSKDYYVAVAEEKTKKDVVVFGAFTEDLHKIAKHLQNYNVDTVAMESTGVYWHELYTVLLDYNIEVYLVNARYVKNVPGRKSDVSDARWLQKLHSYGMLNASFQPDNITRTLRSHVRVRKQITQNMSTEIQRMQKALELMNIKLNNVIRDITGKTGIKIIEAIISGERNSKKLSNYRDNRIKASRETIEKSLNGHWRDEQLFNLALAYEHYLFLRTQMIKCDKEIEQVMIKMSDDNVPQKKTKKTIVRKNTPTFDVAHYIYQATGVELTEIYGIKGTTALTIFSETGANIKEKFPTEKQFVRWLNLVPDNKITGGKVISSKVKKRKNKAGQAFRSAANTLWKANNPLADDLRRRKAKNGAGKAVVAIAKKLASIYYKMITDKVAFDAQILIENSKKYHQDKVKYFEKALEYAKMENNKLQGCEIEVI
jgi:transposase